jgi:hypothetical protein
MSDDAQKVTERQCGVMLASHPNPPAVFAVPALVQTNPYSPRYEHRADGVS